MNTQRIPVSKIKVPDVRVTAVYDEELTKMLHDTMLAAGMIEPIIVVKSGDIYHLVDGLHRMQGTIMQGGTEIDAVVIEGDERRAFLLNLLTNRTRGKTKASEIVKVLNYMNKDLKMDFGQIIKETGWERNYIEKYLVTASAHPEVLDLLDREVIGIGVAYEIARLPELIQQQELVRSMPIYRIKEPEIHAYVNKVLQYMEEIKNNPKIPKPSIIPRARCQCCDDEFDAQHVRGVLLCPDCFGEVFRSQRAKRDTKAQVAITTSEDGGKQP